MAPDAWRRVRGEQEIVVRYEPERALATLPNLLVKKEDRERLVKLVRSLLADERVQRAKPSSEQLAMIADIGEKLQVVGAQPKLRQRSRAGNGNGKAPRKRRTRTE
jgi:hypothetical protein